MHRYEIILTNNDRDNRSVDPKHFSSILRDLSNLYQGYFRTERLGYWMSPEGREYAGPEMCVSTDVSSDIPTADWFRSKRLEWQALCNYHYLYMTRQPIERVE
jgi:hypothetical protein